MFLISATSDQNKNKVFILSHIIYQVFKNKKSTKDVQYLYTENTTKKCLKFVYKKQTNKKKSKKLHNWRTTSNTWIRKTPIFLWSQFSEFDHRFTAMQINILSLLFCSNCKANSERQMGIWTAKVTQRKNYGNNV